MGDEKPSKTVKKSRIYEPTYQLDPFVKFNPDKVESKMKSIIDEELAEADFDDDEVKEKCLKLADKLRAMVKEFNFDRYRLIVVVSIGQRRQQSVQIVHSFLWDHIRDNYATYTFENCQLFCNAVVYGVYLD